MQNSLQIPLKLQTFLLFVTFLPFVESTAQESKLFRDDLKTAVFTTKYVTDDKRDIIYVSHDKDDGAWQFLSNDNIVDFESVAKVVSLEQIIQLDPSVLQLADMPVGYYAERISKRSKWHIKKQD